MNSREPDRGSRSEEFRERTRRLEESEDQRGEKQHGREKLTARERLELLFDAGSFTEIGRFVESQATAFGMDEKRVPGDGVITGYGTIEGREVFAYAQDFTVLGGSLGEMHAEKIRILMDRALKARAPLIAINDSGGARIQEGVNALKGYGDIFFRNTRASGVIPQLAVILGPCAGGAVYSPALTDFIFMVEDVSKMFITGPQVIKAVTGQEITVQELGGAKTHNQKSGVAHFIDSTEEDCFVSVRQLLEFIPGSCRERPPDLDTEDDPERRSPGLEGIVPESVNKSYDVRDVICEVVDEHFFFEVHEQYAQNVVVGFARLNGKTVGVIGNQPRILAGCLDINASDKATRFIRFCDAFNIPLVTLADVPGYLPGIEQEQGGIIRHGAKLLYAYSEATVPKLTVILRKAYGGAYIAMCSSHLGADAVFAWPTAEIAVMGPEGAANIIFRREIGDADDPEAVREDKIAEYRESFANPYRAAARGYIDDVIAPEETRSRLIRALESTRDRVDDFRPGRRHGNMPV